VVEDLAGGGGPGFRYRLEARRPLAAERLSLEVDAAGAPPGGEVALKLLCERGKQKGAVEVRLAAASPEGLFRGAMGDARAGERLALLEGDAKEAVVRLAIAPGAAVGTFITLRLAAAAPGDDGPVLLGVDTAGPLRAAFPGLLAPPVAWDGEVVLLVTPPTREF
jgi:hypothetical protein